MLDKETTRTPLIQTPMVKTQVSEPTVNNESEVTSPLFSEMYHKHIQRMRDNRRREDTICETIETYKDVIELLGDKPISEYTILDGRDYRNSLLKTPKNRKRIKKYKDFNLQEVLSMNIPNNELMSFNRQKQLISRMTSCWNYFADEFDRKRSREGIRKAIDLANHQEFSDIFAERLEPLDSELESDDFLDEWMLREATTGQHISGTCKMGPATDPLSVVDQYGMVYGLEHLRVVDASIMPDCIRANTNVTTMMIGERISSFIKGEN